MAGGGVALTGGGRVLVDEAMRTSVADVYAAGDITSFPRACLAGGEGGGGEGGWCRSCGVLQSLPDV